VVQNRIELVGNRLKGLDDLAINREIGALFYVVRIKAAGKLLNILNNSGKILSELRGIEAGIDDAHIPVGQGPGCGHEAGSPSNNIRSCAIYRAMSNIRDKSRNYEFK
jgi:hypothetical protein